MAQARAKFMPRKMTVIDGKTVPIFGGVFAIFGHGNVAGLGEALYQVRDELPTYRAHNEQGMAHAIPMVVTERRGVLTRPGRLGLRHYIVSDPSGALRIAASRLVTVTLAQTQPNLQPAPAA